MSEGLSVSWCEALCFHAPECNRLDASSVQSQPGLEGRQSQCSEAYSPLSILFVSLLESGDPSSSASLMIYAQISHDRLDGRVIEAQLLFHSFVGLLVRHDECRFLVVDLESRCL